MGARARRPGGGVPAPLPGRRLATAVPTWEARLATDSPGWLDRHRVRGAVLVPAPLYVAMAWHAGRDGLGLGAPCIEELEIREPLEVDDDGRAVQIALAPIDAATSGGSVAFTIHAGPADGSGPWRLHAIGRIGADEAEAGAAPRRDHDGDGDGAARLAALQRDLSEALPADAHYALLERLGIELGGPFRAMRSIGFCTRRSIRRTSTTG